jgi:hypothetical protein
MNDIGIFFKLVWSSHGLLSKGQPRSHCTFVPWTKGVGYNSPFVTDATYVVNSPFVNAALKDDKWKGMIYITKNAPRLSCLLFWLPGLLLMGLYSHRTDWDGGYKNIEGVTFICPTQRRRTAWSQRWPPLSCRAVTLVPSSMSPWYLGPPRGEALYLGGIWNFM